MADELLAHCACEEATALTPLAKAILLTVHYRDIFRHALTVEELRRYLVRVPAENGAVEQALEPLLERQLSRCGDYVTWSGRENLVTERQARMAASARLWAKARRYVGALRRIPFVRMAGVSGSLAVNNAREGADDIDLFCIAQPKRVWLVMLYLKVLALYSQRTDASAMLCPNTCLGEDRLEITAQNLYMAHQIMHVVPLWGAAVYAKFLRQNGWVGAFLPNAYAQCVSDAIAGDPPPKSWGERLIPNGVGNGLNTCICHAGVRKAARFYRRTHTDAMLREARNPQRYMLPGLGYTGAIFRRFMEGYAERFAGVLSRAEMAAAFGCGGEIFVDRRLDELFGSKYEGRA